MTTQRTISTSPIETATLTTPAGPLFVAAHDGAVVAMTYRKEKDLAGLKRQLQRRFRGAAFVPAHDPAGAATAVRRWIKGDVQALRALKVDTAGTPFQEKVWRALRRIPCGQTISYAELARRIDHPTAVRAVASANARNPVAVLIPCHRVIGSDGTLTGYAGGLPCKAWLLKHEGWAGGKKSTRQE